MTSSANTNTPLHHYTITPLHYKAVAVLCVVVLQSPSLAKRTHQGKNQCTKIESKKKKLSHLRNMKGSTPKERKIPYNKTLSEMTSK